MRGLPVFIHAKSSAASSIDASDVIAIGRFLPWPLPQLPPPLPDVFRRALTRASPVGDTSAAGAPLGAPLPLRLRLLKFSRNAPPSTASWSSGLLFLQPTQLHCAEQPAPAWKHSQYFFKHADLRQRHPTLCTGACAAPLLLPLPLLAAPPAPAAPPPALVLVAAWRVNLVLKACALRAKMAFTAASRAGADAVVLRHAAHLQAATSQSLEAAKHWQ